MNISLYFDCGESNSLCVVKVRHTDVTQRSDVEAMLNLLGQFVKNKTIEQFLGELFPH